MAALTFGNPAMTSSPKIDVRSMSPGSVSIAWLTVWAMADFHGRLWDRRRRHFAAVVAPVKSDLQT